MLRHHHATWPGQSAPVRRHAEKKHVFIGLDFGTTFTKISYFVSGTTENRIKTVVFSDDENPYLLPSLVWVSANATGDGARLHADPPLTTDSTECLKYFKYSMALKGLDRQPGIDLILKFENGLRLVSAFFLGCALAAVRQRILQAERLAPEQVEWYVNLGVPAGTTSPCDDLTEEERKILRPAISGEQMKDIFSEVLNVGWAFSKTDDAAKRTKDIADLDSFYTENKRHSDPEHLNCVPELYAEVLLYYQDRNVPEGFYCVVDVGGGTVDLAIFHKRIDTYGTTFVECAAQAVAPLGFETLLREVVTQRPIDECVRNDLADKEIPRAILDQRAGKGLEDSRFNDSALANAVRRFRTTVGRHCLNALRLNQPTALHREIEIGRPLSIFLLGGGRNVCFYRDVINESYKSFMNGYSFPDKVEEDILNYLEDFDRIDVKDNPRILISQMLAQPFDWIPELDGTHWRFERHEPPSSKEALSDWQSRDNDYLLSDD